ncbi:helix-turn-helix transcriptional regulator [Vibrio parahaemolyticus]|uniref:helix-turn-helix transcriptional regulator n=1 Tax=Vibrio parahaemolyticus TaxID=670 RepID=UPI00215BB800|nr:AlpA family transcriptional regulator [Vibrio parahaemolyticus]MCR9816222.1 AlpA family transcriptional regulator [Vibrio parahaemolyticus]
MTQLELSQNNSSARNILRTYGESERLCREKERRQITSLSRTQAWVLEREGQFPKRKKIGRTNVWLLSDLLLWAHQLKEGDADE